jgi:hypothetical protein
VGAEVHAANFPRSGRLFWTSQSAFRRSWQLQLKPENFKRGDPSAAPPQPNHSIRLQEVAEDAEGFQPISLRSANSCKMVWAS